MYFINKMPKIQIKSKSKKNAFRKDNEDEYEEDDNNSDNNDKNKKKTKIKNFNFQTKINYLGSIKFNRFRKFAYNGLIESQCDDEDDDFNVLNAKMNKNIILKKKS